MLLYMDFIQLISVLNTDNLIFLEARQNGGCYNADTKIENPV